MRRALLPLLPAYAAAQALNDAAYARGWRRVEHLEWPVVSIGNLSVGGAGKTPFVMALAAVLGQRGWMVDVLSRGYGRNGDAAKCVETLAADASAQYGDEPLLIAQAGVPVFVGRQRVDAGRLAEATLAGTRHIHLLDDGMQHRKLARNAEIVLLHRTDFATTLLPAGRLREPLAALGRADFVVLREEDAELAVRARRWMRAGAEIWIIRRELDLPPLPGAAVAFSAIAHPDEFVAGLRMRGVAIAAERAWRDHHRFTDMDVASLCELAKAQGAACFVTTAKDVVRLTGTQRARLEGATLVVVAELRVSLLDAEAAVGALEARLADETGRREKIDN